MPFERDIILGTGYKEPLTLIEDMMAQLYDIEIILRLLALVSLANQVGFRSQNTCYVWSIFNFISFSYCTEDRVLWNKVDLKIIFECKGNK